MIQSGATYFSENGGMGDSFINLENVFDAAEVMTFVDTYAIKHNIVEDADEFISELKTALDNFNEPFKDRKPGRYSHTLLFDTHLTELLNATKNLYDILTDDGKETVKKYIENKKIMRNNKINEKNEINSSST